MHGKHTSFTLPHQLPALVGLQTLIIDSMPAAALPVSLGALTALTALALRRSDMSVLPLGLGLCTQLCLLDLWGCSRLGTSPEGVASLRVVLSALPHLEALRLSRCGLGSLPQLTDRRTPPLRLLDISGNACAISSPRWLTWMKELWCSWW